MQPLTTGNTNADCLLCSMQALRDRSSTLLRKVRLGENVLKAIKMFDFVSFMLRGSRRRHDWELSVCFKPCRWRQLSRTSR